MENETILHKCLDDLDNVWIQFPQVKKFDGKRMKVWGKRKLCSCEIAVGANANLGKMSMNTSKTRTVEQVSSLLSLVENKHSSILQYFLLIVHLRSVLSSGNR